MIPLSIAKWWAAKKAALLLFAGAVALGGLVVIGLVKWGQNIEAGKCEAAAQAARAAASAIDLNNYDARWKAAIEVNDRLTKQSDADRARIRQLEEELKTATLQSTKPGAKTDAKALLDDRCNYTPLGRRRVRE